MDEVILLSKKDSEEILNRYADMVFKLALAQTRNRSDAEDVFQEVFFRLIQKNTPFENEEHVKAWLLQVTVNRCKKLHGSAWFRHTVPITEDIPFSSREKSDVFYAVLKLPAKYRTVIHLFYYEDMSVHEISAALKCKESTVTSQLCRARGLLKISLKGEFGYAE